MEKELVMRKHVIQEVCLSALEVEPQVKDDVFVIERKSEYASSAVQYIYNEMNRLVDYSNSRFGQTFIQMHFPEYADDKELALDIADFYWVLLELERRGKEIDEDELIGSITPEVDDFFRNFFLERHLKELAEAMKGRAVSLHPKTFEENEWSDWMIEVFKGNRKRLSFFFERCDGKKCPDIVREIRGAMMAKFIAIKEDDYDKRRYGEMRQAMSEYGYKTGDEKGSQWNQCMNEDKEKNGKVNKIPSIKAKYEEFMKSEAF